MVMTDQIIFLPTVHSRSSKIFGKAGIITKSAISITRNVTAPYPIKTGITLYQGQFNSDKPNGRKIVRKKTTNKLISNPVLRCRLRSSSSGYGSLNI
ncbi:MAG: hypothetical protein BWY67_01824 [Bacteroidetes bacterium ADurb.Bin397]|nr:MAG: hypothetical protein BWY67_01824 [Bacteroidetes bacterium ADurb.Bin397]